MEYKIIEKILAFLNDNEGKPQPKKWVNFRKSVRGKILSNEPLTDEELIIEWSLSLRNSKITSLPKGLEVYGSLDLHGCEKLKSLPEGLEVGGDLNLTNCTSLTSLPEGLKVGGYFTLENCKSLTSLPEELGEVNSLYLTNCTSLASLPKGLKVNNILDLVGCEKLESLPKGLEVGFGLNLTNCTSLTSLPEGLKVGDGGLSIWGTPLAKKYTDQEIIDNVASTGGEIKGGINRKTLRDVFR
jgi:hypothetical protein